MKLLKAPRWSGVPRERRVLVLSGDSQVGLWVVRNLARNGLRVLSVCRSEQGLAAHSRYSSGAWALGGASCGEACFIDQIEKLARDYDVASIMPIDEAHHGAFINTRDRFEPDIHLFSPPAECFRKAIDKGYLHNLCCQEGISVARGTRLDKLMAQGQDLPLRFPLVLRTSNQNLPGPSQKAPWKAAYAKDFEQLKQLHEVVADMAANVLVQEYHRGVEDHIQILMLDGKAFMVGEYYGEHHMPLAGGVTVQRVSCHHERLVRDAERLLQAIGWEGMAAVQFHFDRETGNYIFLEINPRFCGGLPTVIRAGFEAPFLLWQSHFEREKMKKSPYRVGLRTRILGGDANWVLAMCRGDELPPGQHRLSKLSVLGRFIWNCGPWTRDDVFLLSDLKPFWIDLRHMAGRLGLKQFDLINTPASVKENETT